MENLNEQENLEKQDFNLSEAFKKFRREKVESLKHKKFVSQIKQIDKKSHLWKKELRQKFIDQAKKYFGVPYHKKYHKEETDEFYNAPLYLDCCGLIRQIIVDLKDDFGFTLAKWNQAYQFDTLPIDLKFEDLKPGDLVFIAADYNNKTAREFAHKIVHVEIFTGGETREQTIGAREQKGVTKYFDSYKFDSKNYFNNIYYFKSIDTWLEGICKSFCPEHPWVDDRESWVPEKYSIFADPDSDCENEEDKENLDINIQQKQKVQLQKKQMPVIYIGKGNNDKLIQDYFTKSQHKYKILDKDQLYSKKFDFKWVQLASEIDYFSFKEASQVVCHIPNIMQVVGNKGALLQTLQDYKPEDNFTWKDILPETYRLDQISEQVQFLQSQNQGIWILKPLNMNQGKGIEIITDINAFRSDFVLSLKQAMGNYTINMILQDSKVQNEFQDSNKIIKYDYIPTKSIIQKYVENTFLINNRKFDIRCYVLIACTKPFFVLYHSGYLRLCLENYNLGDIETNKFGHISNAAVQKKHKNFKEQKEESIWSTQQFGNYLLQNGYQNSDINSLNDQIKKICKLSVKAAQKKLDQKIGYYELLGIDIMLDSNLKPYLLEVNMNPALFLDCNAQKEVIPKMMYSTLDLVLKINEDTSKIDEILQKPQELPLGDFEILYNDSIQNN